jgi:hypothetical protein
MEHYEVVRLVSLYERCRAFAPDFQVEVRCTRVSLDHETYEWNLVWHCHFDGQEYACALRLARGIEADLPPTKGALQALLLLLRDAHDVFYSLRESQRVFAIGGFRHV